MVGKVISVNSAQVNFLKNNTNIEVFFNLGKISPYLYALYVKKCKEEAYSM